MKTIAHIGFSLLIGMAVGAFAQDQKPDGGEVRESDADAKKNKELQKLLEGHSFTFMSMERELFFVLQLVVDGQWFSFVVSPTAQDAKASRSSELMNTPIKFKDALDSICGQPKDIEWVTWRGVVYVKPKAEKLPVVPRTEVPKAHRAAFEKKVSLTVYPFDTFDKFLEKLQKEAKLKVVASKAARKHVESTKPKLGFVTWRVSLADQLDISLAPIGLAWKTDGKTIQVELYEPKSKKPAK